MNKNLLLIIGNGFDLAHKDDASHLIIKSKSNIPNTSYTDFIKYLPLYQTRDRNFILADGNKRPFGVFENPQPDLGINFKDTYNSSADFYNRDYHNDTGLEFFRIYINEYEDKKSLENSVIWHLCKTVNMQNWVDIENEYFDELCRKIEKNESNENIKAFNDEFEKLISILKFYLSQWTPSENSTIKQVIKQYSDRYNKNPELIKPPIHVLNFNYTNTFDMYQDEKTMEVNHIHGRLDDESNHLIFGYGNEEDDRFKLIRNNNNEEYRRFIKSYLYSNPNSSSYKKLKTFVDSNNFDIEIIGHSCGSSDGVLLNYIFEHNNCERINVKYYQWKDSMGEVKDDFQTLRSNISNHFSNMQNFRDKLVSEAESHPLIPITD